MYRRVLIQVVSSKCPHGMHQINIRLNLRFNVQQFKTNCQKCKRPVIVRAVIKRDQKGKRQIYAEVEGVGKWKKML